MATRERLAKQDPGNAEWQRDLAVSHFKIGVVLARQGQKAEALKSFEAGRTLWALLVQMDPSNATWRKDLEWVEGVIAEIKAGQ